VYPRLAALEPLRQLALGHLGFLTDFPEQAGHIMMAGRVWLLGHAAEASTSTSFRQVNKPRVKNILKMDYSLDPILESHNNRSHVPQPEAIFSRSSSARTRYSRRQNASSIAG
jgi:hypothetical protein